MTVALPGGGLCGMTQWDPKTDLHRYLQLAREALLWKLDGLSEYDIRRLHVVAETNRHAGHADIVRELIDGAVGLREGNDNMPPGDQAWWQRYRDQLERVALEAGHR